MTCTVNDKLTCSVVSRASGVGRLFYFRILTIGGSLTRQNPSFSHGLA